MAVVLAGGLTRIEGLVNKSIKVVLVAPSTTSLLLSHVWHLLSQHVAVVIIELLVV